MISGVQVAGMLFDTSVYIMMFGLIFKIVYYM